MNDQLLAVCISCACALISGVGMLMARRLVRCAALLLVHSLSIAAAYFVLAADFLAIGQVVVYAGAIVVLFLFVVLLLPDGGQERRLPLDRAVTGVLAGLVVAAGIFTAVAGVAALPPASTTGADDFAVAALARELFGRWLAPFELTAVLLLIALVGAVAIWQRSEPEERA